MLSRTRGFGGKHYEIYDLAFSREEAVQETEEIREEGFLARMVPTRYGTWQIYRRKRQALPAR